MERELEVKVLVDDIEKLRKYACLKGARLIGHENQNNIVINSSEFPLIEDGSYLRIREIEDLLTKENRSEFTFKKKIKSEGIKENLEYTINFDDTKNLLSILKNIKLDKFIVGQKERYSYSFLCGRLDFDYWDKNTYPKPYLEIEVKNEEDLEDIIKSLDIDKKQITTKSIKELQDEIKNAD